MSDECQEKQPVDIVNECQQEGRPIGFASTKDQIVIGARSDTAGSPRKVYTMEVTGHGYGSSVVSQQEADQLALDRATEHGYEQLRAAGYTPV